MYIFSHKGIFKGKSLYKWEITMVLVVICLWLLGADSGCFKQKEYHKSHCNGQVWVVPVGLSRAWLVVSLPNASVNQL